MFAIDQLIEAFKARYPDFQDFENNPGDIYPTDEYEYKIVLSEQFHKLLDDWVESGANSISPDVFRERLGTLLRKPLPDSNKSIQNLSGWRDNSFLLDDTFSTETNTRQFMALLHPLLVSAGQGREVSEPLENLIAWMTDQGAPASLTKVFPSLFMFVWNPQQHYFIKPRDFDSFLRLLGEKPLGSGKRMTSTDYLRSSGDTSLNCGKTYSLSTEVLSTRMSTLDFM
jgi:hypothetical protein